MKLFIPALKTKLCLLTSWKFGLFYEGRNSTLMKALGDEYDFWKQKQVKNEPYRFVSLPKDTVLIVDRIYIRNGAKDFDSVTFRIESCPDKKFNKKRFWAKLPEVNGMDVEVKGE